MLLEDFLQLLAGLGGQNVLYLQVQDQTLPLSKFVLAREDCQLLCGGQAITLAKFRQLTGKGSSAASTRSNSVSTKRPCSVSTK